MAGSRAVRAGLALALATFVAGCGSSHLESGRTTTNQPAFAPSTGRPPVVHQPALRAALVRSVSTTRSARTALTSVSVTVTGAGQGGAANGAFDVAGTGAVDLATGNADLLLSIPQFDRVSGGGAIEERIVDGVAYARLPADVMRAGGMPPAVRWLRIDAARPSAASPSTLSRSQVDPVGDLAFLGAVSDNIRPVGVEAVRETPTTHYAATITRTSTSPPGLDRQLRPVGLGVGPGPVDVDVWIDDAGLTRRIVVSVPLVAVGARTTVALRPVMRIQADYYGFGVPVPVTAPPAAQVRPFTALRVPSLEG